MSIKEVRTYKYYAGGRTGPESLNDFTDVIWINAHSDQRQYPF
jgi:hypothetical protein